MRFNLNRHCYDILDVSATNTMIDLPYVYTRVVVNSLTVATYNGIVGKPPVTHCSRSIHPFKNVIFFA